MNQEDYYNNLYLAHHGVKGQKWGVRRYQNKDGSLTEAGKKRKLVENDYPNLNYEVPYDGDDEKYYSRLDNDPKQKKANEEYSKLDKKIKEKTGDWYNSEWKNPELVIARNDYDKEIKRIESSSLSYLKKASLMRGAKLIYDNKVIDETLKDLDYDLIERNRNYIRSAIFVD